MINSSSRARHSVNSTTNTLVNLISCNLSSRTETNGRRVALGTNLRNEGATSYIVRIMRRRFTLCMPSPCRCRALINDVEPQNNVAVVSTLPTKNLGTIVCDGEINCSNVRRFVCSCDNFCMLRERSLFFKRLEQCATKLGEIGNCCMVVRGRN